MMYWYDDHGMHGWGWFAMSVGMLLFWVVVIVGAVLLVRALIHPGGRGRTPTQPPAGPPAGGGPAGPSPEQVLADRFARGEIDEREYHARLATLRETADRLVKH
ncbi:SHOCT domain-containing protein [Frankia sp. AgB1.9]|uniref:SHOCT domain-containing protein n=1 Tax=unclassified Frankia TaxID=2632575 RepID=UPI001932A385|nr:MULTISPECIES: SHOCT domain-containing protein [unclassified Frankia]MBL7487990.1 SHOCT domain-containing protein [Frankia sp. AgW1.1]MBL7549428.1 SHOCT domain-containing protein [Frankia sp. AgB1.9]MBL7622338.1 SHOCT domain-containing protein [Frankia sp. AgB1.8]